MEQCMTKIKKIIKLIFDNSYRFDILSNYGFYNNMDDEEYLRRKFKTVFNRDLNLDNPKTFNEKLQWLKLYDRNSRYTTLVDKYKVREYIASELGEEYLIPLIGVWDDPDDIDFNALPNQFVLKCNHNSGKGMFICTNKDNVCISHVKKKLKKGLKENYYIKHREWPYKNVKRKVIAEELMIDNSTDQLIDYKFMCFNGKHQMTFVCDDRFSEEGLKVTFYDKEWNILPFERHYPRRYTAIDKPKNYDKMVEFAEKLSEKIPFLRVDFYEVNGLIYFGELTFFPGSGYEEFTPESVDYELGKLIKLPR